VEYLRNEGLGRWRPVLREASNSRRSRETGIRSIVLVNMGGEEKKQQWGDGPNVSLGKTGIGGKVTQKEQSAKVFDRTRACGRVTKKIAYLLNGHAGLKQDPETRGQRRQMTEEKKNHVDDTQTARELQTGEAKKTQKGQRKKKKKKKKQGEGSGELYGDICS